jgi:hypothetical protein
MTMKRSTKSLTLIASLAGVILLATAFSRTDIVSRTHADNEGGCSGAALAGVYAASFRGSAGGQPLAAAGFIRLGANLTIRGRDTLSLGGVITPRIITGTYTVDRDSATGACRGTATTSVGNFSYATTGEKHVTGALFVNTDTGVVLEGQTIRQGKAENDED